MIKIVIIGSGNVAQHLIKAFDKSNIINVVQLYSRTAEAISHLVDSKKITTKFSDLINADLYIIAVSDDAIVNVSSQLPFNDRLVVHTSGSVTINDLDGKNRKGVFYPLQTFSKNNAVDFKTIPICLESENQTDYALLEKVAASISDNIYKIDSKQRKSLHVSAVFVNNFVNHLYQIGNEICLASEVPFDILKPLILETARKVQVLSPNEAQTGPAKRNDKKTIASHLEFLENENQITIYKTLTQSIQNNGKKL